MQLVKSSTKQNTCINTNVKTNIVLLQAKIDINSYILQGDHFWQLHSKPAAKLRFSWAAYHVIVTNHTEARS